MTTRTTPDLRSIPITEIHECPWNPRRLYDETKLKELAASITATNGVIEPAIVRSRKAGGFELLVGSRRLRATKLTDLTTLDCIVRELDDDAAKDFTGIENLQRENLTAYEEAQQYALLLDVKDGGKTKYTVAAIAARQGKDESYVYRHLKLLKLEKPLVKALEQNRLSVQHALLLARLEPEDQLAAAGIGEKGKFEGGGVVWRSSPLFDRADRPLTETLKDDDGQPGLGDHQPLHELQKYLRDKTQFNPKDDATRHFQPQLAADLDDLVKEQTGSDDQSEADVRASIVSITDDPMARSRMGLGPKDETPLTPSRWREVEVGDECEWTVIGCHTQGPRAGQSHLICTAKTKCKQHFKELRKKTAAATATPAQSARETKKAEDAARQAETERAQKIADAKYWNELADRLKPAIIAHCAKLRLTAALLVDFASYGKSGWGFRNDIKNHWGITLTDKNVVQAMGLSVVNLSSADATTGDRADHCRRWFLESAKRIAFNPGPVEQKLKNELKAWAKKGSTVETAAVGGKTKKAKKK